MNNKNISSLKKENKILKILLIISCFLLLFSFSLVIYNYFYNKQGGNNFTNFEDEIEVTYTDNGLLFIDNTENQNIEIINDFPYKNYSGEVTTSKNDNTLFYLTVITNSYLDGGVSTQLSYYRDLKTLIQIHTDNTEYEANNFEGLEEVEGEEGIYYLKKPSIDSNQGIVLIAKPMSIINNYKALRIVTFYNEADNSIYTYDPQNSSEKSNTECVIDLSEINSDSEGYIGYYVSQAILGHIDACESINNSETFLIDIY
jgi:hypothetical protein